MIYNGFLTAEFWSARNPVFVQFVVRQNEEAASGENCGYRKTPESICIHFIIHTLNARSVTQSADTQREKRAKWPQLKRDCLATCLLRSILNIIV